MNNRACTGWFELSLGIAEAAVKSGAHAMAAENKSVMGKRSPTV